MPVPVTCPSCQARVRLPDNSAGKKFRCPKCQGVIPGQGPAPPPKKPVVRPAAEFDPGLTDAPEVPQTNLPNEPPLPISSAARQATRESFNPFDEGTEEEEDESSRKKRYYQPKENYNPFDDKYASSPGGGTANPEETFDFGEPEGGNPPSSTGDFDFGSSGEQRG